MSAPQIMKHMSANDIPLFASYLLSPEGQEYTAWEFDVIVGKPADPGAFFPTNARRQAMYLNALKIDAVAWFHSTPRLVECKPVGGLGALGQILGYQRWYEIIFGIKPMGIVVCERMSEQVQILCLLEEIRVLIVRPATATQVSQALAYVRPLVKKLSILPEFAAVQ